MPSELDLIVAQTKSILAQCQISANQAAAAAAAIGSAGLAPLQSPLFTGDPRAPTPDANNTSASIATTAWVGAKFGQPSGIATLDPSGVIPVAQLPFAGLTFKGSWDAQANTPTLVSGSGTAGNFYVVSVSGSTNLNGITTWNVGDQVLFSGSVWQRIPYTAPPISNLPLASLEGIAAATFVGNTMGGSASPQAIPISSVLGYLPVVTTGGSGLCPTLPGGTGTFLRADGAYAAPAGTDLSAYAPLNSPAFTGTATVATQVRDLSSTAIASTTFVIEQQAKATEAGQIKVNGTVSAGTSTYAAKIDHIHPTDTSRMAAANGSAFSPTINGTMTLGGNLALMGSAVLTGPLTLNGTLTQTGNQNVTGTATVSALAVNGTTTLNGTATGVTPTAGDNSTKLATTAYVQTALAGISSGIPIPSSSTLAVGSIVYAWFLNDGVNAASVTDGNTTAGSNLRRAIMSAVNSGGSTAMTVEPLSNGATLAGTWRNISGVTMSVGSSGSNATLGMWVRTA